MKKRILSFVLAFIIAFTSCGNLALARDNTTDISAEQEFSQLFETANELDVTEIVDTDLLTEKENSSLSNNTMEEVITQSVETTENAVLIKDVETSDDFFTLKIMRVFQRMLQ